jgi:hypothetical protein
MDRTRSGKKQYWTSLRFLGEGEESHKNIESGK